MPRTCALCPATAQKVIKILRRDCDVRSIATSNVAPQFSQRPCHVIRH